MLHIREFGSCELAEWHRGLLDLLSGNADHPAGRILLDLRAVDAAIPRAFVDDIIDLIDQHQAQLRFIPWAIVVGDTVASFGMARMIAVRAALRDVEIRVYTDIQRAIDWLRPAEPARIEGDWSAGL